MDLCHVCATGQHLESHHIFYGSNRKTCDKFPLLQVKLCQTCHRGTWGIHGMHGKWLDTKLKRYGQTVFEREYGDRNEFMELFGRNYLWE